MKKKKDNKEEEGKAEEPSANYAKRTIHIFHSFEEQEEYELKKMAALSPHELMVKLEQMRLFFMRQYLLPDGTWPPLAKTITIKPPKTS